MVKESFSLNVYESIQYQSNLELFYQDIYDYIGKYKIYLCVKTTHYFEEMKMFLKSKNIKYERQIKNETVFIFYIVGYYTSYS